MHGSQSYHLKSFCWQQLHIVISIHDNVKLIAQQKTIQMTYKNRIVLFYLSFCSKYERVLLIESSKLLNFWWRYCFSHTSRIFHVWIDWLTIYINEIDTMNHKSIIYGLLDNKYHTRYHFVCESLFMWSCSDDSVHAMALHHCVHLFNWPKIYKSERK